MSKIKLMTPHKGQIDILNAKERFIILNCPRRFGKTETGKILASRIMIDMNEEVYWISPNFSMATDVWEQMKSTFSPIIIWKSEQQRMFRISGGGTLRVFSGEKYENLRGTSPYLVIIDEAAIIPKLKDMWNAVIRPALQDKKGRAYFLSTPKGRGYFYELYKLGLDDNFPDYRSFKRFTWENPFVPKSEIFEAKKTMPAKLFAQEYMAEFLLDYGEVFKGVTRVATGDYHEPYEGNIVFGIDLARKNDYTVVSIWDVDKKQNVSMLRINKVAWKSIKEEIIRLCDVWKPSKIIVEENHQDSIIEDLRDRALPVRGFWTGSHSKSKIINKMAVAIENEEIVLLSDTELINEFQAFEMNMTAKGNITYGAPLGYHDDIVMANAFCVNEVINKSGFSGKALPNIWSRRY